MSQHPAACANHMKDTHHVVWDSGASMCITNNKSDFVGSIEPIQNAKGNGLNSHLQLEGVGTVCWSMLDTAENIHDIKLPAYYAPKA